jgi:hypothetical protein
VGRVTGPLQVLAPALVAAHLLPVRLILAVECGEGDVRERWRWRSRLAGVPVSVRSRRPIVRERLDDPLQRLGADGLQMSS